MWQPSGHVPPPHYNHAFIIQTTCVTILPHISITPEDAQRRPWLQGNSPKHKTTPNTYTEPSIALQLHMASSIPRTEDRNQQPHAAARPQHDTTQRCGELICGKHHAGPFSFKLSSVSEPSRSTVAVSISSLLRTHPPGCTVTRSGTRVSIPPHQ